MNDNLTVDLVIEDSAVDRTKAKLNKLPADIAPAAKATGDVFTKALSAAEIKALDLHFNLKKLSEQAIGTKGIDGLGLAALRTGQRVRDIYARLKEIETQSGRTYDAKALRGLENEARQLNAELDKVTSKVRRVAAGRAAAAGQTGAGGFGKYGSAIGAASSFLPPELSQAASGIEALSAAGIGAGSLAVFGGLAVSGLAIVKISQNIREEAERRLKVEENIAAAVNKQVLSGKDVLKVYNSAIQDRDFSHSLQNQTVEQLRRRLALAEQILKLDPSQENAGRALEIRDKLYLTGQQNNASADKSFDQRWEDWKKAQEEAVKAEREFAESVEQGKKKAKELHDAWDGAFGGLFQKLNSDNPFALFLLRSASESEKLKESLKGLSPELQRVALIMKSAAEGKELFGLRLDNTLGAINLHRDAAAFLNPTEGERQAQLQRGFNEFLRTSNSTNPDVFFDFLRQQKSITDQPKTELQDYIDKAVRSLPDARSADERSAIDRRIIGLTQGVDPSQLRSDQRRLAYDVREREAARQEAFEREAARDRKEMIRIQSALLDEQKRVNKVAQQSGLAGVNKLVVEVQDKSPSTQSTATIATPDDVVIAYGLAGGSGGLTSF
jgi:hypothetical protein